MVRPGLLPLPSVPFRTLASAFYPAPDSHRERGTVRLITELEMRWFGGACRSSRINGRILDTPSASGRSDESWSIYEDGESQEVIALARSRTTLVETAPLPQAVAASRTPAFSDSRAIVRKGVSKQALRDWQRQVRPDLDLDRMVFLNGVYRFELLADLLAERCDYGCFLTSLSVRFHAPVAPGDSVSYRTIAASDEAVALEGFTADGRLVEKAHARFSNQPRALGGGDPQACPVLPEIVASGERFTSEEALRQVQAWSERLARKGAGPGVTAGVLLDRSASAAFLPVALSTLDAIYFPLNLDEPAARLEKLCHEADPAILIVERSALTRLPAGPWRVLTGEPAPLPNPAPCSKEAFRGCSYLMTTSGSTGEPKLHRFEVEQVESYLKALAQRFAIGTQDRYLHTANFSFSASIRQIFLPLHTGATLVLAQKEQRSDLRALASLIESEKITTWDTVPSLWRLMEAPASQLGSLRRIFLTGEALTWECCRRWSARYPDGPPLFCLYSQTETAGTTSVFEVSGEQGEGTLPLGKALADVSIGFGDPDDSGAAELLVSGPRYGGRTVATGDLVSIDDHGNWRFAGRKDRRVKWRGMQVHLDEIEAALKEHSAIRTAAVARTQERDGAVHAWIVAATPLDENSVREHLAQRLSPHKIPAAFHFVAALPLTASGKVAWGRLEIPAAKNGATFEDGIDPKLRAVWEEVLQRPVPAAASFRDLGGDSLLAIRLITAIEKEFGSLQGRMIGELTTLREFAAHLENGSSPMERPEPMIEELLRAVAGRAGHRPSAQSLMVRLTADTTPRGHLFFCANGIDELLQVAPVLEGKVQLWMADSGYGRLPRTEAPVKALAAWHVRDIQRIQPEGPVRLAGYSYACVLASEIARQLQAAGREIAMVGWLDNLTSPAPMFRCFRRWENRWQNLCARFDGARGLRQHCTRAVQAVTGPWKKRGQVTETNTVADPLYAIAPTAIPVYLFTPNEDRLRRWLFPTAGWKTKDFPQMRIIRVPGDHHTMLLDPRHAAVVAGKLLETIKASSPALP